MTDETGGGWIFVSHSHLDLDKVRQIRNFLEAEGHKPLLFFLKCLADQDARLPILIREEIMARTWFILCKSEHAEVSQWVRDEVAIVVSRKRPQTYVTVDLAKDFEPDQDGVPKFAARLRPLLKRATVFLSYARSDAEIARQIHDALVGEDYRAFMDIASLPRDTRWEGPLHTALDEALRHGFVLLLLSPDYLASEYCERERKQAFALLASRPWSNLVPVIVREPAAVQAQLPPDLRYLQCIDVTKGSVVENVMGLLDHLKERPMV
jgi:hypothetical protein